MVKIAEVLSGMPNFEVHEPCAVQYLKEGKVSEDRADGFYWWTPLGSPQDTIERLGTWFGEVRRISPERVADLLSRCMNVAEHSVVSHFNERPIIGILDQMSRDELASCFPSKSFTPGIFENYTAIHNHWFAGAFYLAGREKGSMPTQEEMEAEFRKNGAIHHIRYRGYFSLMTDALQKTPRFFSRE